MPPKPASLAPSSCSNFAASSTWSLRRSQSSLSAALPLMRAFEKRDSLTGDRGFASFSLQRRASCEPDVRERIHQKPCDRKRLRSGCVWVSKETVRRVSIERCQSRIEAEPRPAVGTEDRVRLAHIDVDVRVVLRWGHADALEFPHPDADLRFRGRRGRS